MSILVHSCSFLFILVHSCPFMSISDHSYPHLFIQLYCKLLNEMTKTKLWKVLNWNWKVRIHEDTSSMMNDGRHFGRRPFLSFFVSLVLPPRPPTTAIILLRCIIYTTILDLLIHTEFLFCKRYIKCAVEDGSAQKRPL